MISKKIKDEFKSKSDSELIIQIAKMEKEVLELKFKMAQGKEKNLRKAGQLRSQIAYLKQLVSQKNKHD